MFDKRLLGEAAPHKTTYFKLSGLHAVVAFSTATAAYAVMRVIDGIFLKQHTTMEAVPYFAVLLFAVCAKAFFRHRVELLSGEVSVQIRCDLRARLRKRLVTRGLPLGETSGTFAALYADGIEELDGYFAKCLPAFAAAAVVPATFLLFLLPFDWLSALLMGLTAPLIPIFMVLIGKTADHANEKQWQRFTSLNAQFLDRIAGLATLKLLGRGMEETATIERVGGEFRDATLKVLRIAFLSAFTLELAATMSIAVVAVAAGLRLLGGHMEFRNAFFILLLAPEFYAPLRKLGAAFHAAMPGIAAADRLYAYFESPNDMPIAAPSAAVSFAHDGAALKFSDVGYTYPGRAMAALEDISFEIPSGCHAAIVGASGAGKTTLLRLLLRRLHPHTGEILANGKSLQAISAESWGNSLAYIPQAPHIFAATVWDNITLGRSANTSQVEKAASLAGALTVVKALGWQTKLGDGGRRISGGQAQRIALARAFLTDAPLVLLDEPARGLDLASEAQLSEALSRLPRGKTIVSVTHRLHTAMRADLVVVLDCGRIAAVGRHEELVKHCAVYRELTDAARGVL